MSENRTIFSDCRTWRYHLWRPAAVAGEKPGYVNFICLNPSTADEVRDDPTVRRCMGYAAAWGYSALMVTNVFALRSTDPAALYRAGANPVGPHNDGHIFRAAQGADLIVAAWGEHAKLYNRDRRVMEILACFDLNYLRLNSSGRPGHPLYLPSRLKPIAWEYEL